MFASPSPAYRSRRRRPLPCGRTRPEVEVLEDRTVPTIVFTPQFGVETLAAGSTNDGMQHPTVNLIFSGSYWTTTQGQTDENTLTAAAKSILSGPYLSGLTEYGSDGKANFGQSWNNSTTVASNPSTSSLQTFLQSAIDNHTSAVPGFNDWQHAPIYVVISDPTSSAGNNGGWNAGGTYNQAFILGLKLPANIHMVYVGTSTQSGSVVKDFFTETLSHELAETISDPDSKGIQVNPPSTLPSSLLNPGGHQIGDYEPEQNNGIHYGYRLFDGNLVQPYWSVQNNAFIVPDGSTQNFTLAPIWNTSNNFTGTYNLTVTGDQEGINTSDAIRIDTNSATSGVKVLLNGETATFDNGAVKTVNVNTGGGSNLVVVAAVPVGVTLNVDSLGRSNDLVIVGNNGSLAGIQGTVNISNTSGQTNLFIDDSADTARNVTVTNAAVTFSSLATINYAGGNRWSDGSLHGVTSLTVIDGKGTNCVDVESVSPLTATSIWADTQDIFSGSAVGQTTVVRNHT